METDMYSRITKYLIFTLNLLFFLNLPANSQESIIELSKELRLHLYASKFDSSKHLIKKCKISDWRGVCLIDNNPVFGTDWEFPKTILDSAKVAINNSQIELDVSCMFDPWYSMARKESFIFEKTEKGITLSGLFSDGAGTYVAQWRIISNKSIRTVISDDEEVILSLFPQK